jgi:uncharacterized membrane protein
MTKNMTVEEMRKITKIVVAETARQAQAAAAKHRARPENRSARLRQAESDVKASKPRGTGTVHSDMERDTKPVKAKPAAKRAAAQAKPIMNRAGLLVK